MHLLATSASGGGDARQVGGTGGAGGSAPIGLSECRAVARRPSCRERAVVRHCARECVRAWDQQKYAKVWEARENRRRWALGLVRVAGDGRRPVTRRCSSLPPSLFLSTQQSDLPRAVPRIYYASPTRVFFFSRHLWHRVQSQESRDTRNRRAEAGATGRWRWSR